MPKSSTPKHIKRKLGRISLDALKFRNALTSGSAQNEQFALLSKHVSAASQLASATRLERADCIGSCLRAIGTGLSVCKPDLEEDMFQQYFDLIVSHTTSPIAQLAAHAIWALGDVGIPPEETREKLILLVNEKPRFEPGKDGACRGVAFRVLARIDINTAMTLKHTPACLEFVQRLIDYRNQILARCPEANRPLEVDTELLPWIPTSLDS